MDVEGGCEQRCALRVEEMSRPKVAGVMGTAEHDLQGTTRKRLGDDTRSVDAALRSKRGEEDGSLTAAVTSGTACS